MQALDNAPCHQKASLNQNHAKVECVVPFTVLSKAAAFTMLYQYIPKTQSPP
jgi:hypothetical protein